MNIYIYVLDTLADWELGYVCAELNSRRYFRAGAPEVTVKTVACTKAPVKTMGGLTVMPDCLLEDIAIAPDTVLLLPGANTWAQPVHGEILRVAGELLGAGATVCAICGATVALADAGFLDSRPHTSNGPGFLEMFAPTYKGAAFYVDAPSVADGNLITAACTGALLWAKQIIERLDVFKPDTLEAWYQYFSTGTVASAYALMGTLTPDGE